MISGGPIADMIDDPNWKSSSSATASRWANEGGFASPSIHGVNYATNLYGILHALHAVNGDLSDNQAAFQRGSARRRSRRRPARR
jgi:branched-chain amino acid transport system substrate-binding protein